MVPHCTVHYCFVQVKSKKRMFLTKLVIANSKFLCYVKNQRILNAVISHSIAYLKSMSNCSLTCHQHSKLKLHKHFNFQAASEWLHSVK